MKVFSELFFLLEDLLEEEGELLSFVFEEEGIGLLDGDSLIG